MPYARNGALFVNLPSTTTPVNAAWLNGVDDALVALSNDRTITTTAAAEIAALIHRAISEPTTASSATDEAALSEIIFRHTVAPNVGSHVIGHMGRAIRDNLGGSVVTAPLIIGAEGIGQNRGAGQVTLLLCNAGHMNRNDAAGTIVVGAGFGSFFSNNQGAVTTYAHFYLDAGGGEVNNPALEYSLLNPKSRAEMLHRGRIFGAQGYLRAADGGGAELAPPPHAGMVAGVRYGSPARQSPFPATLNPNYVTGVPVFIAERCTLASFGCTVTTAGAGGAVARIGLYPFARGVAKAKVAECAEFAVDVTGKRSGAVAGSIVVEAGWYLLGLNTNSATVQVRYIIDATLPGSLGTTNDDGDDTSLLVASTYGALPTTPTFARFTNPSNINPELWLTVA